MCLIQYSQLLKWGKISLFYLHDISKTTLSPAPPLSHSKVVKYWNFRAETQQSQSHIPNGNATRKTGKHPSNAAAVEQQGFAWLTPAPRAGHGQQSPAAHPPLRQKPFSSCNSIPAQQLGRCSSQARGFCLQTGELLRLLHQLPLSSKPLASS